MKATMRLMWSSPGFKWVSLGWSGFIAENLVLSENRGKLIEKLGDDTYHIAYSSLSLVACSSIGTLVLMLCTCVIFSAVCTVRTRARVHACACACACVRARACVCVFIFLSLHCTPLLSLFLLAYINIFT